MIQLSASRIVDYLELGAMETTSNKFCYLEVYGMYYTNIKWTWKTEEYF